MKNEKQTSSCLYPGCSNKVGDTHVVCRRHWNELPEDLRGRVQRFLSRETLRVRLSNYYHSLGLDVE